jgi:hypothetical protein
MTSGLVGSTFNGVAVLPTGDIVVMGVANGDIYAPESGLTDFTDRSETRRNITRYLMEPLGQAPDTPYQFLARYSTATRVWVYARYISGRVHNDLISAEPTSLRAQRHSDGFVFRIKHFIPGCDSYQNISRADAEELPSLSSTYSLPERPFLPYFDIVDMLCTKSRAQLNATIDGIPLAHNYYTEGYIAPIPVRINEESDSLIVNSFFAYPNSAYVRFDASSGSATKIARLHATGATAQGNPSDIDHNDNVYALVRAAAPAWRFGPDPRTETAATFTFQGETRAFQDNIAYAPWFCPESWKSNGRCDCECSNRAFSTDPECGDIATTPFVSNGTDMSYLATYYVKSIDFVRSIFSYAEAGTTCAFNPTTGLAKKSGPEVSAPPGWTCDPSYYGARDGCDCNCGCVDIDCLNPGPFGMFPIFGCAPGFNFCGAGATCVASIDDIAVVRDLCQINARSVQAETESEPRVIAALEDFYVEVVDMHNRTVHVSNEPVALVERPAAQTARSARAVTIPACQGFGGYFVPEDYGFSLAPLVTWPQISDYTNTLPPSWTASYNCNPAYYNGNDGCDCNCGAVDSDCTRPYAQIFGCAPGVNYCTAAGTCTSNAALRAVPADLIKVQNWPTPTPKPASKAYAHGDIVADLTLPGVFTGNGAGDGLLALSRGNVKLSDLRDEGFTHAYLCMCPLWCTPCKYVAGHWGLRRRDFSGVANLNYATGYAQQSRIELGAAAPNVFFACGMSQSERTDTFSDDMAIAGPEYVAFNRLNATSTGAFDDTGFQITKQFRASSVPGYTFPWCFAIDLRRAQFIYSVSATGPLQLECIARALQTDRINEMPAMRAADLSLDTGVEFVQAIVHLDAELVVRSYAGTPMRYPQSLNVDAQGTVYLTGAPLISPITFENPAKHSGATQRVQFDEASVVRSELPCVALTNATTGEYVYADCGTTAIAVPPVYIPGARLFWSDATSRHGHFKEATGRFTGYAVEKGKIMLA